VRGGGEREEGTHRGWGHGLPTLACTLATRSGGRGGVDRGVKRGEEVATSRSDGRGLAGWWR
jgi:hypothetical protein